MHCVLNVVFVDLQFVLKLEVVNHLMIVFENIEDVFEVLLGHSLLNAHACSIEC